MSAAGAVSDRAYSARFEGNAICSRTLSTPTRDVAGSARRTGSAGEQAEPPGHAEARTPSRRADADDGRVGEEWIADPLRVAANKPRSRYDEVLGVRRGSERPRHLA